MSLTPYAMLTLGLLGGFLLGAGLFVPDASDKHNTEYLPNGIEPRAPMYVMAMPKGGGGSPPA